MRKSCLFSCVFITSVVSVVHAFSVTVGNPTQCDDLPVSWTGGQAPFQIIVTAFSPSQALRNISVPASAFNNGKGSYSIPQFPFKNGTQFLLTMSDATGFGSGGTSTILTVGPPVANNNCNDTVLSPDFFFSTPLELQQCTDYEFSSYDGAVLPVTITGLIPGGEDVILSNVTTSSYTWVTDVAAGTNLIFFVIDSQGRQGGVSPLNVVQPLSNTSCINVNSPSSTASAPSQTSSQSPPGDNTATVGIIAGATVGGVVFLALLIILGIWCIRRSSRQSGRMDDGPEVKQIFPYPHQTEGHGNITPFMQHESHSYLATGDTVTPHVRQMSYTDSFAGSSSISSASRRMAALGGPQNTFHQALPVGLAPPVHPGTHSHKNDAPIGNYAVNGPYASFNQMQPSRLSANTDAGNSSISSSSRQMDATGRQSVSYVYSFTPPGALSHQTPASSFPTSDLLSPLRRQPPQTNLDTQRFATHANAGNSSMASTAGPIATATGPANSPPQIIIHTDIDDVPMSPDEQDVIELPPQYADRPQFASQPAPTQKSSLSALSHSRNMSNSPPPP